MPYDGLFSFLPLVFLEGGVTPNLCQCPMTGFFHFYDELLKVYWAGYLLVSMPYDGLFSFLHVVRVKDLTRIQVVSMPYDGLFSFLRTNIGLDLNSTRRCQCPMTGFFHFYSYAKKAQSSIHRCMCQCPMTGFFHFYLEKCKAKRAEQAVSMPYDGLFSFLPLHRQYYEGILCRKCQCPMTGFFHFCIPCSILTGSRGRMVSMPYDGLFSFLRPSNLRRIQHGKKKCQYPMTGFFHFYCP